MEKLKIYIKPLVTWVVMFVVYLVVLVLLHQFGLIKLSAIMTINYIFMGIVSLLFGIIMGKKSSKNGYLEGLKQGGIIIIVLFLLNLIFVRSFSLTLLLYYLLILAGSTIGSMIGINLKR